MIEIGTAKIIGTALYQWEKGRKVLVTPAPNTKVTSVQFAHHGDKEALAVAPRDEDGITVADIPNILLQSGQDIIAYVVDAGEGSVETTGHSIFRVVPRPKPGDYIYTETEVLNWESLDKRVTALEQNGTGSVSGAVKTVNGVSPDENGNVDVAVPQISVERFEVGDDSGVNIYVGTPNGDGGMSWEFAMVYDGKPGDAGYTPIKGVDYFTEGDKAELVAAVLAGIPAAEGVEF